TSTEDWGFTTAGFFGGDNPLGISHFGFISRKPLHMDTGDVGVNIFSGWTEKPVNVTYTGEDGNPISGVIASAGAALSDTNDAINNWIQGYGGNGDAFGE